MEAPFRCGRRTFYKISAGAELLFSVIFVVAVVVSSWTRPLHNLFPVTIPFQHVTPGWLVAVHACEGGSVSLVIAGVLFFTLRCSPLAEKRSMVLRPLASCRQNPHRVSAVGGSLGFIGTAVLMGNVDSWQAVTAGVWVTAVSSAAVALAAVVADLLDRPKQNQGLLSEATPDIAVVSGSMELEAQAAGPETSKQPGRGSLHFAQLI